MEDSVVSAVEKGLKELGFLAHAEKGVDHHRCSWLSDEELEIYWRKGLELREQYADRIVVSLGLEVGLNIYAVPELLDVVNRHPWDRIGLSFHHVPHEGDVLNILSQYNREHLDRADQRLLTRLYYQGLLEYIPVFQPYMVCHLDVPRKKMVDFSDDPEIQVLITKVLEEMVRSNSRLEINTSGYDAVGEPFPAPWIIRKALGLGLELVVCSDSHHPDQIGRYYDAAAACIHQAVQEVTAFDLAAGSARRRA